MVVDEFINNIERVYGEYENPVIKTIVKKYLIEDIDDRKLSKLYRIILYTHKAVFKAPCVATIEECIDKAIKIKNKSDVRKFNESDNRDYDYANMDEFKNITEEERAENIKKLNGIFKGAIKHD